MHLQRYGSINGKKQTEKGSESSTLLIMLNTTSIMHSNSVYFTGTLL